MKALLAIASDRLSDLVTYYLRPLGFDVIRYKNPIKAMDNVDEVAPEAIIVSALDFPRHWKPFVQYVRSYRPKENCVFIILKGNLFPFEEAAKAVFLGVNGVIHEDLSKREELERFQHILKRYLSIDDNRSGDRFIPSSHDRIDFTFAHPERFTIISGRVEAISPRAISFKPDIPELTEDLRPGQELPDCCLRIGEAIRTLTCKILRSGRILAIELTGAAEEDRDGLSAYLSSYASRVPPEYQ
jgi:hypothetical protein